jgi:hypothetical protein
MVQTILIKLVSYSTDTSISLQHIEMSWQLQGHQKSLWITFNVWNGTSGQLGGAMHKVHGLRPHWRVHGCCLPISSALTLYLRQWLPHFKEGSLYKNYASVNQSYTTTKFGAKDSV